MDTTKTCTNAPLARWSTHVGYLSQTHSWRFYLLSTLVTRVDAMPIRGAIWTASASAQSHLSAGRAKDFSAKILPVPLSTKAT